MDGRLTVAQEGWAMWWRSKWNGILVSVDCDALNPERTRLLAVRTDLNAPLLSSKTEAERDAQIIQVNGKLYAIAKVQSKKSCPAVANVPPSSVVR